METSKSVVKQASLSTGIPYATLYGRIKRGMTLEEAKSFSKVSTEVLYKGSTYPSLKALASAFNINYNTVIERLRDGMLLEEAIDTPVRYKAEATHTVDIEDYSDNEVEYNGKFYKSLASLALAYNISVFTLYQRLKSDKTLDEAITLPVSSRSVKEIEYNGLKYTSLKSLAGAFDLNINTLNKRLKSGLSLHDALTLPVNKTKATQVKKSA